MPKLQDMTASLPSLPCPKWKNSILTFVSATLLPMDPWIITQPINSCTIGTLSPSSRWIQRPEKPSIICLRESSVLMTKKDQSAQAAYLTKTAAIPTPKVLSTGAISTAMVLISLANAPILPTAEPSN